MKTRIIGIGALALAISSASSAQITTNTQVKENPLDGPLLVVTASNTPANQLLVYNSTGVLLKTIATRGKGGVGGNAGGIAHSYDHLAVVNFGSGNVSVFNQDPEHSSFKLQQLITTISNPVSVAFGHNHLYILTTTHIESHLINGDEIGLSPDGMASLVKADGTAAQVGVLNDQLVITEKSNAIETVKLDSDGAVTGATTLVVDIPANVNAPFGLATRGDSAYVTIAHADEISLVRSSDVLTVTGSGTQHAPCWVALDGPYLLSANSPSKSVSRYVVYGQNIIQDAAVVAQFTGSPTDIAYNAGLAAVIDSSGAVSHVSIFKVDDNGNLTLRGAAQINNAATNGVAIVRQHQENPY